MSGLRTGRGARARGFALADFIAGTLVFGATLSAFVTLTNDKFRLLGAADGRARALAAAEARLDAVRVEGLSGRPSGEADPAGFRRVAAFAPGAGLPDEEGVVEARSLVVDEAVDRRLYEVRVTIRWRDAAGDADRRNAVRLSTAAPLPLRPGEER